MNDLELRHMLDFASVTALHAGEITRSYFGASYAIETKSDKTLVTQADKEVNLYIHESIEKHYPDHSILSEELKEKSSESAFRWVVDPIDGTFSFVSGIPYYSVLIALQKDGTEEFGIAYFPELHKMFIGCKDQETRCNGIAIHQRRRNSLRKSLVLTSDPAHLYRRAPEFCSKLFSSCKAMRTWADAYAYVMLAEGRADVALDYNMKIWDLAALLPILQGSRSVYSLTKNSNNTYNLIAATHTKLLQEVCALHT